MEVKPTNSELEILQVIWRKGSCTVRDVNEQLVKDKSAQIGYTTTLKLMQIMHEKGNKQPFTHLQRFNISVSYQSEFT